jgi:hypothetical protein
MGVTVSDENVDDQPPDKFCELLEPVGKDIKDQSADGIVVGRLVFLVGINVEYFREVFDMDAVFILVEQLATLAHAADWKIISRSGIIC